MLNFKNSLNERITIVSNFGVGHSTIFKEKEDYIKFTGFINEYLNPQNLELFKKSFTVKGKTFQGVSHLPKNYSTDIQLVSYSLKPTSFEIYLKEITQNSIEKFMQSLLTRYSIYFNKKYTRRGSLFAGPYKKSDAELNKVPRKNTIEVIKTIKEEETGETIATPTQESHSRSVEYAFLTTFFVLLLGISLRNINIANASQSYVPTLNTSVLSVSTSIPPPSPSPTAQAVVNLKDGSDYVNIRSGPSTSSEKIGRALQGQVFDVIPGDSTRWIQVKLENGNIAYISVKYVEIKQNE